ncbi:uncharacterized protein EI90DRAFT_3122048 [Cantharellus anzutake]|uniref:uncharacterized protein n=1 Tax=Cantharellus anzutake TaxID=1750568 RepID=UPI001904B31B|nr:uncharacterized protein EI90DRAFT_3122048 [Cantharellus anzutake]KAF8333038.1 hypothetical protein EI90DRAFT_3122048 [Cantharellus anzutake]
MSRGGILLCFPIILCIVIRPALAQTDSGTPVYFAPPPETTQISSSTTYNYCLTAALSTSSPFSSLPNAISISTVSASRSGLGYSGYTRVSLNKTGLVAPSTTPNETTTDSSPSRTDVIKITATTSPKPHLSSLPTFKLIYLAPLFAILGIFAGATVAGMMYSRVVRRYQRKLQPVQPSHLAPDPFPYRFPPSRSLQMELGRKHTLRSMHYEWVGPSEGDHTGDGLDNNRRNKAESAHEDSPGIRALKAFISGSAPRWFVDNEGDRAPLVSPYPDLAQSSHLDAKGPPIGPSGDLVAPGIDPITPLTVASNASLDDDERIYGHKTHGSIRRKIAERLRMGSRRLRHGGRETDATEDERGSSADPNEGTVLLGVPNPNELIDSGPSASSAGVRKVSGSKTRAEGTQAFLRSARSHRETGRDDSSYIDSSHSPASHRIVLPSDRMAISPLNVSRSGRSRVAPASIPRDPSINEAPITPTASRYKARSRPFADSPVALSAAHHSHPIPDAPQRVISPPAHPELFFADPILGHYLPSHQERRKARRSRAPLAPPNEGPSRSRRMNPGFQRSPAPSPEENSPNPPSTASSFLPPAKTKEVLGRVNAVVKNAYGLRETPQINVKNAFREHQEFTEPINRENQEGGEP